MLAASAPSAAEGARVFQRCFSCHSVDPAEGHVQGPNLAGIVGRSAGTRPGYSYSPALRRARAGGLVWTEPALDRFLADPEAMIPGTEMSMPPLRKPRDRQAVIRFLQTTASPR